MKENINQKREMDERITKGLLTKVLRHRDGFRQITNAGLIFELLDMINDTGVFVEILLRNHAGDDATHILARLLKCATACNDSVLLRAVASKFMCYRHFVEIANNVELQNETMSSPELKNNFDRLDRNLISFAEENGLVEDAVV